MSKKIHQSSSHEYQIRVDGKPVYWPDSMDKNALETFATTAKAHPDCYVDIVRVNTEIIMSQFEYHQMRKHFSV